jgi:hypothetical protein
MVGVEMETTKNGAEDYIHEANAPVNASSNQVNPRSFLFSL